MLIIEIIIKTYFAYCIYYTRKKNKLKGENRVLLFKLKILIDIIFLKKWLSKEKKKKATFSHTKE